MFLSKVTLFGSLLTKLRSTLSWLYIMIDFVCTEILPSLKPELDVSSLDIRIIDQFMGACMRRYRAT